MGRTMAAETKMQVPVQDNGLEIKMENQPASAEQGGNSGTSPEHGIGIVIRGAAAGLVGLLALAACETPIPKEAQMWGIKHTGLEASYPAEASCPKIASPFGSRYNPNNTQRISRPPFFGFHNGIDIPVSYGTPVRAMTDGVVMGNQPIFNASYDNVNVYTGHSLSIFASRKDTGLERDVFLDYAHLQQNFPVKSGQKIKQGEVIGYAGHHYIVDHLHVP